MDLSSGLAEVNTDAELWNLEDEAQAAKSKDRNVVFRKISLLWE